MDTLKTILKLSAALVLTGMLAFAKCGCGRKPYAPAPPQDKGAVFTEGGDTLSRTKTAWKI